MDLVTLYILFKFVADGREFPRIIENFRSVAECEAAVTDMKARHKVTVERFECINLAIEREPAWFIERVPSRQRIHGVPLDPEYRPTR